MRYIAILMLSFAFLSAVAQDDNSSWKRPSWWTKKSDVTDSVAQKEDKVFLPDMKLPVVRDLIAQAVTPSLSIVRQQYCVNLNGQSYGLPGQNHFGETYSLAIKVDGASYLSDQVLRPWRYDPNYYALDPGKYTPALYKTYQRKLTEESYVPVQLELETVWTVPTDADSALYRHSEAVSDFGLSVDTEAIGKPGYLVWVLADDADSTVNVTLETETYTHAVTEDVEPAPLTLAEGRKVLGALFVVPQVVKPGVLQFCLAGVAVMNDNRQWYLRLLRTEKARS